MSDLAYLRSMADDSMGLELGDRQAIKEASDTIEQQAKEIERLEKQANLYGHMLEVAEANGFHSLTDAITTAKQLREALQEIRDLEESDEWNKYAEGYKGSDKDFFIYLSDRLRSIARHALEKKP